MIAWGLNERALPTFSVSEMKELQLDDEKLETSIIDRFTKEMAETRHYMNVDYDPPQVQFVNKLIERKIRQLRGEGKYKSDDDCKMREENKERDYVLKITLTGVRYGKDYDVVWRKIKVPGSMTLGDLQDRVIQLAMGWCRRYHMYLFTDRSDGALFGPISGPILPADPITGMKPAYADKIHLPFRGHAFIPDTDFTIGDVLLNEKSCLGYDYDLGDLWTHEITVEEIRPVSSSDGKIIIISGNGACPPEDYGGNINWSYQFKSAGAFTQHDLGEIKHSANYISNKRYHNPKWSFDPFRFDLDGARCRVAFALDTDNDKHLRFPNHAVTDPFSFGKSSFSLPRYMYSRGSGAGEDADPFGVMCLQQAIAEVPYNSGKGDEDQCGNCGAASGPKEGKLMRCTGCLDAYYCSKECQQAQWKRHRLCCKKRS